MVLISKMSIYCDTQKRWAHFMLVLRNYRFIQGSFLQCMKARTFFESSTFVPAKNIGINFNYVCPAIESHSCKNCVEPRNIYFKLAPQSKSYRNALSDSGSLFGVTQVRSNGASWNYEVTEASYNT